MVCVYCKCESPDVDDMHIQVDIERPGAKSRRARSRGFTVPVCHRCWATLEFHQFLGPLR